MCIIVELYSVIITLNILTKISKTSVQNLKLKFCMHNKMFIVTQVFYIIISSNYLERKENNAWRENIWDKHCINCSEEEALVYKLNQTGQTLRI